MPLPRFLLALSAAAAGAIVFTHAAAAGALDFRDVDYRDQGDAALAEGKSAIAGAIPIGSATADGILRLRAAGARCRPLRSEPGAVRCLYNQMSPDGDGIDEVRWTTILHSRDGRVTDVGVRRDIDIRVIG
jgi:hypothetical protein